MSPAWIGGASGDPVYVALDRHIRQGRTFDSLGDVASQFGDTRAGQINAMAAAAGVTRRTAERWFVQPGEISPRTGRPKQRRSFDNSRAAGPLRAEARRRFISGRIRQLRQRGVDMRLIAERRVSRITKVQEMPAPRGGRPATVHIGGPALVPALNAWLADDQVAAADELLDAFFAAYGLIPDELGEIRHVHLE